MQTTKESIDIHQKLQSASFKVKILKCSNPPIWYATQRGIGKIYEVVDYGEKYYRIVNNGRWVGYVLILKEDCEILPNDTVATQFHFEEERAVCRHNVDFVLKKIELYISEFEGIKKYKYSGCVSEGLWFTSYVICINDQGKLCEVESGCLFFDLATEEIDFVPCM